MLETLVQLVDSGTIRSFEFQPQIDSGCGPDTRLIDALTLEFNDGKKLKISTFCSGCLENSCLHVEPIK